MNEPVVFFKPGCPFGIRLRIAMTLHGVAHRSVRFRDDEEGAAAVRDVNEGNEISPTVHVAGRWLTNPGWRDVRDAAASPTARARRRRRRCAAAAGVVASMVFVGCGSDGSVPGTKAPEDRASTSTSSETPSVSQAGADVSILEGTWRTRPVSLRDAEATLRRQGLAKWVEKFRQVAPFSKVTVLDLSIEGGQWNLYGESEDGREPIDYDADYQIDGHTVTFNHSNGATTHEWSVAGDTLTLEFARGTMPDYEGIPDEVFQRALYMTETFTRQS